jgi:hypothetical protein
MELTIAGAYTSKLRKSSWRCAERRPAVSRRLTGSLDEPGINTVARRHAAIVLGV